MKKRIYIPLLILLGILVSLGIIEIMIRVFYRAEILGSTMPLIYEPHDQLGHVYRPGAVGFMRRHGEIFSTIAINDEGFRDYNYPREKPPHVFRIAVLGDSFVTGNQVALDATFPKVLEDILSERYRGDIEVLNFGVEGYCPREELFIFRRTVRHYHPDLVLLALFPLNDVEDVQFGPVVRLEYKGKVLTFRSQREYERLRAERDLEVQMESKVAEEHPLISALKRHIWLFRFIEERRVKSAEDVAADLRRINERNLPEIDREPRFYSAGFAHALGTTKSLILDLRREVENTGAAFAMVVVPADLEVAPEEWSGWHMSIDPGLFSRAMHLGCSLFAAFGVEAGIPTLNLLPVFRAHYPGQRLYWTYDAHWTEEGHALAAERIADFLAKENLLGSLTAR